jgi:hypothetical protein
MTLILSTIEWLQHFPDRGVPASDAAIRQIVIRFGSSGYIIRYAIIPERRGTSSSRAYGTAARLAFSA